MIQIALTLHEYEKHSVQSPPPASQIKAKRLWASVPSLSWIILLIVASEYFPVHPQSRGNTFFFFHMKPQFINILKLKHKYIHCLFLHSTIRHRVLQAQVLGSWRQVGNKMWHIPSRSHYSREMSDLNKERNSIYHSHLALNTKLLIAFVMDWVLLFPTNFTFWSQNCQMYLEVGPLGGN